jgi:hypothetical protein
MTKQSQQARAEAKALKRYAATCVAEQLKIVASQARRRASEAKGKHRADLITLAENIELRAVAFINSEDAG